MSRTNYSGLNNICRTLVQLNNESLDELDLHDC